MVNKTWKADNFEMVLPLEPSELEAIKSAKIQKFVVPKINFEAQTYPDLIDWENSAFSEPPLTALLTDTEIRDLEKDPLFIPPFPCHTQSVERGIRLITEAASSVIGEEA